MNLDAELIKEVGQLKREYQVSSQNAFNYLRAQEDHRQLGKEIQASLRERDIDLPYYCSPNIISNLCELTRYTVNWAVDSKSCQRVIETGFQKFNFNNELLSYSSFLEDKKIIETRETNDCVKYWKFDYKTFLINFLERMKTSNDFRIPLRETIEAFVIDSHPYFEGRTGERFSFTELCSRDEYMLSEIDLERDCKDDIKEQAIKLEQWSRLRGEIDPLRYFRIDAITLEKRQFLTCKANPYFKDLYQRAVREGTLHNLDVERRIALNEVEDIPDTNRNVITARIQYRLDDIERRRINLSESLHSLGLNKEEEIKKLNYRRKVLKINKTRLIDELEKRNVRKNT